MPRFALLSQGRLFLHAAGELKEVTSHFGKGIRDRALSIRERNAWKYQGSGAKFMGMRAMQTDTHPDEIPIDFSGVARGGAAGELIYTITTPEICGLLSAVTGGDEQRLWHSNGTHVRDLARDPKAERLACAVLHNGSTSGIGVMGIDGRGLSIATEGDSMDLAPRWVPGRGSVLIFQSAGVGRNRDGMPLGLSPFAIQRIDLETHELETVAESPTFDFLAPQCDAGGRLHYIRRPYRQDHWRPRWATLLDVMLLPWRLIYAIFQFFNFFSMMFTGRPLSADGPARHKELDTQRMVLWGNVIDAQKAMRKAGPEEAPDLVPRTWELVRRELDGSETVLARSVLSYDLCADGSVLYSNGSAIFLRKPDGAQETVVRHRFIEQVVALDE